MLSRREILDELRRIGFNEISDLKKSVREFERYIFENYGLGPEEPQGNSFSWALTEGDRSRGPCDIRNQKD
jgi:hypothetical protein